MHLFCPHCHNPIEVVDEPASDEILCPCCGSAFRLDPESTKSYRPSQDKSMLGRFHLLGTLGMGGFGTVYKARDPELDRLVAIKVPRVHNVGSGEQRERFVREARSVAQLRHPSIVPVHEVGEQDGQPYLVSDFVEGVTLDDWLSAHQFTHHQAAELVAQIADALQYAHEHGVIHRDIKPSNIMLDSQGAPHVMDFGLAKRNAGEISMTVEGQILGTPACMSPEQARGESHTVDARSDVYSLGVILYKMLTGELPFAGNQRMLLHQVLHDEPKAPRKMDKQIPVDLETICLKAMEKDSHRRYQTAGAMADDLRRYLNRFPISARPAGPVERVRKWVKRHSGLAAGVGLAFVAVVLAAFFGVESWRERQERVAGTEKARQEMLKEKKQRAKSLIFSGQFPEAEQAIEEAEELGVEEEWALWRRGQIAFHSGEVEKAIPLVERAVARMPDNPAAKWLLGTAYQTTWNWQRASQIDRTSSSLTPSTPEDALYKGLFRSFDAPKAGLKALDEGLPRQPALIAHVVRAEVLARMAIDTSEVSHIEKAMEDVTAAKTIQPGNALALGESVYVHHLAAILYDEGGQIAPHDRALRIAKEDADALRDFPDIPLAVVRRSVFLEDQGRMEDAFEWYETGMRQKEVGPSVARDYAWLLFERERVEEARKLIERYYPPGYRREFYLALMVAELSGDGPRRAEKICDGMSGEPAEFCMWFRCLLYNYLGLPQRAREELAKFRADFDQLGPIHAALARDRLDLFRNPDPATGEKFLNRDRRSKRLQVLWHLCIAVIRLGEGDRAGASRHFEQVLAAHEPYQFTFHPSRACLARMKKNPAWPPWIQVKK
jgi:tRNA A-37 threonylcarbamoyl transferase component Bud32/tetratricopeptide (TPR) repeat protein